MFQRRRTPPGRLMSTIPRGPGDASASTCAGPEIERVCRPRG